MQAGDYAGEAASVAEVVQREVPDEGAPADEANGEIDLDKLFTRKIMTEPNTGCWLWLAERNQKGYGRWRFPRSKRHTMAHLAIFRALRGALPMGKEADHLCRVRHCVNPFHIEPVTHRENLMRGNTIVSREFIEKHGRGK